MAMTTAAWAKMVALEHYDKPFLISAKEKIFEYDKIFSNKKMDYKTWQTFQFAGPSTPGAVDELQLVPFDDSFELGSVTATAVKYANGLIVSEEAEEDNRNITSWLSQLASEYSQGHMYVTQVAMTSVFENAFDSNYAMWDGTEMCGTHTTNEGSTYTNYGGTGDITWTNIWNAFDYFSSVIINEAGLPISDEPACIQYYPTKARLVEDLLANDYKPSTTDNDLNTIKSRKLTPVPNRLLTSGRWFIHGKRMKQYLLFLRRKKLTVKWKEAFQNIGKFCRMHQRFTYVVVDPRFIYGYNAV
jgi:hypothetical protein